MGRSLGFVGRSLAWQSGRRHRRLVVDWDRRDSAGRWGCFVGGSIGRLVPLDVAGFAAGCSYPVVACAAQDARQVDQGKTGSVDRRDSVLSKYSDRMMVLLKSLKSAHTAKPHHQNFEGCWCLHLGTVAVAHPRVVHSKFRIGSHYVLGAEHSRVVRLKTRIDLNRAALVVGRTQEELVLSSHHSTLDR